MLLTTFCIFYESGVKSFLKILILQKIWVITVVVFVALTENATIMGLL